MALAGLGLSLLGLSLMATVSQAQDVFPSKPINMIVPFAPGGASDVIARLVSDEMGRVIGQRIVNENMGGAGGTIALARAAQAAPDGYTIVIGNSGTNAASYTVHADVVKYKPEDFMPIGLVAKTSPMIAVKLDHPAKTLAELVDFAKKNPGKVTLGHAGVGSSNYLICQMFIQAAKVEVSLVSYRGAGPALNDLMGGQIDGVCDNATSLIGAVQGAKVRALVVATPNRIAALPDIPTSVEAGLPAFQAQGWNALFAPRGTPQPVIDKLNAALKQTLASDGLRKRFDELASVVPAAEEITPAYVDKVLPGEIAKFKDLLTGK
ncbi:MAG: tripartite tricarboxylate transporter substrate-binding protein [Bosea sp. (in: a-proteobacteria)]